ncbi:transporter [Sphingomonas montana]|uniref:transporter n=1 Tax=Sphingomonas montana TaxID=1843236 RepID=UPI00096EFCCA|nr:transporter [Sphingomonas montana]
MKSIYFRNVAPAIVLASLALAATPAAAQDATGSAAALRPYCPTRPSLGAGACIVDIGHPMLEMGIGDWQRTEGEGMQTDVFVTGDALLRVALGGTTEVQVGWTAVGRERARDADGMVARRTRIGDVALRLRQNIVHPDGSGFSIAVQPFVTLPIGREPIGAGTWGGGVTVPMGYEVNDVVQLQLTAELDATPDEDGRGRHRFVSAIGGIALALSDAVSTTVELSAARDRDPDGFSTILLAALSGGYQVSDNAQVDAGTAIGLNADSPDVRVFVGFSRRF